MFTIANYVPYHIHSMLSNGITNIDSITDFHAYVDAAKEYGMKAFAFSEHGSLFAWLKKKEYIESQGMKYIHAIEAYLTEDNEQTEKKTRDNYHIVLIAKNYDGVKEINKLISKSFNRSDFHFYYMPRISFEELLATSDNIIVTTACLGGVLHNGTPSAKEKILQFVQKNRHRCFLEIQHHNCAEQIEYNKVLFQVSVDTGVPLIAGTDTHALNDVHMDGRAMLQKAKNVHFSDEDAWDLTFKSYEQLVAAYKKQNSLPMDVVLQAIENTNKMADMVEEFTIDYSPKYPKLYENSEEVFKQKINEGYKSRCIASYPNHQEYLDRIHYEYDVYKHNGAIDFMLLEENYKSEMRKRGIKYGYSRGSVSGSIIAYLLYITEIDSVKYNLNFERFMSRERVSLADVDTDWLSEDREAVKDYLHGKPGLYCCDIVTFNTIALKGAIRDIGRALEMPLKEVAEICDSVETNEESLRKKYKRLFKYVDMVNGVVVSVGNHPAGCVVSPMPVDEWFGTFTTSSDKYPVSMLNMKEIDSLNFVKLDILGLDNIGLIYKTCELANIPFATPDNIPPDDMKVWESIRDDTTMIFQWESQSATQYLKQLLSDETVAKIKAQNKNMSYMDLLSMGNGAIRPAGESYRDKLANGIYQDNGHEALNEFMKPTLGYCIEENQLVSTIDGNKQIKDICVGDTVYTKSGISKVTKKVYMGVKDTIKLHTAFSDITCTKDHKIFTHKGWQNAGDIELDDSIAVRVGNSNTKSYDISKLMLIGYLLGDGMLGNRNNVGFVNRDIDVVNNFRRIVEEFDNCTTSVVNRKSRINKFDLYYVNVKHIVHHKIPTSVAQYLFEIGLKVKNGGKIATNKFIPEFIFKLNTECLLAFLGAYTDTDCSVKNCGRKAVKYKTSSKMLCDGIVEILRLAGFVAFVYYDEPTRSYQISVPNSVEYLKSIYQYSFKVRKAYTLEELNNSSSKDGAILRSYIKDMLRQHNKYSLKKIYIDTGINLYQKYKFITTKSINKIHELYPELIPDYLLDKNIVWTPVTGIEENGESNVYDLTIENEHNFICQYFVVHNCIFQEQIIEFLHSFCGYSMGEADIVRRGFAKKTGTEKFIPKIKAGFIKTMKEKYNVDEEEAETLIVNFIKVIEDASDYLFSKNHADPYSWIGYICGYLRYYYPFEFITTALNIFEGKEEKSLTIINYAKKRGIKISPIKFRHSIAKYSFDKESNQIFKGISSIKYMNEAVANEIYALKDNKYDSFIDLLYDLDNKTSINSRQLSILIELDFFEEFGDTNYLLELSRLYDTFGTKSQIKKDKLAEMNIDADIVRRCCEKESDKTFSGLHPRELLIELSKVIHVKRRTLKERIEAQTEHLGYIDISDNRYSRMLVVMDIDTKYSPRLKMYSLKNGTILDCKIDKRTFNKNKLEKKDIIRVVNQTKKPKLKRLEDGTFEPIPGTLEIWLTNYERVENI